MIETVSAIGSGSMSAGVRSLHSAATPTEGPSFEQALAQAIGSAVDTLAGRRGRRHSGRRRRSAADEGR